MKEISICSTSGFELHLQRTALGRIHVGVVNPDGFGELVWHIIEGSDAILQSVRLELSRRGFTRDQRESVIDEIRAIRGSWDRQC